MIENSDNHVSVGRQRVRPVLLVVLDGWGFSESPKDNAIAQARTPNFDRLWSTHPHALLRTSGRDVGLPEGQMGNSEVGHLHIGAGRLLMQELPRISDSAESGELARAPELTELIQSLRRTGGRCHVMGLVSPGGVHSHQDHAVALARILTEASIPVSMHVITDGRDTPPRSAADFVSDFCKALPASVKIATLCGRYYAMDRDQRWERVTEAYRAIVEGVGASFTTIGEAISSSYAEGVGDEFILPAVIGGYRGMQDGDGLLCFNFRPDRVREILASILDPEFASFPRKRVVKLAAAVGLTPYGDRLKPFLKAVFRPQSLKNCLGEVVSASGLKQLRIAETEKYAHVTYFLNGGREVVYPGEDRILVPSPKVATYDLQPEMSAPEVTDKLVEAIGSCKYDLIVANFANPDMVGHTGNMKAAIKAIEVIDTALGRVCEATQKAGGALLVTADHGNSELMRDPVTHEPHTAHTTNPVPLLLVAPGDRAISSGQLSDLAPTVLDLMGVAKPAEMTGASLLRSAHSA